MLHADLQTLILLFVSVVTSCYALGTFCGKLAAFLLQRDEARWGDVCGVVGGLIGIGVYIGVVIDIVSA